MDVSSGANNRLLKDTSPVTDYRSELLAGDPEDCVQSRAIFEVGSRKIKDEHLTSDELIVYEVPLDVIAGIRSWFSDVSRVEAVRSVDLRFSGLFAGLEMRVSLEEPSTGGHRCGPDRGYDGQTWFVRGLVAAPYGPQGPGKVLEGFDTGSPQIGEQRTLWSVEY
jgi:hypothetical protein